MTTLRRRFLCAIGALLLVGLLSACGLAESGGGGGGKVLLRLSHQWPGASQGEGDFRAVLAQHQGFHRLGAHRLFLTPGRQGRRWLEHDPEKWKPVFGKDHAQAKS